MIEPGERPVLSVVVVSWNTCELTLTCLRALARETAALAREIIVVDNASTDGSPARIAAEFPALRLIANSTNLGYAAANNQGVERARGRYVCLLNSDTEVRAGALDRLVEFLAAHPEYGAAAPRLVGPDGAVQRACMRFPGLATAWCYDTLWAKFPPGSWIVDRYFMRDFDHQSSGDVDQPPGACLLLRRDEYLAMGGMDAALFLFFSDVDLCRRLWAAGRRIRYVAGSDVLHHRGASTRRYAEFVVTWHRDRIAYYRKQYGTWTVPFLRLIVRWRAVEEQVRASWRHRDAGGRAAERASIRLTLRKILNPS